MLEDKEKTPAQNSTLFCNYPLLERIPIVNINHTLPSFFLATINLVWWGTSLCISSGMIDVDEKEDLRPVMVVDSKLCWLDREVCLSLECSRLMVRFYTFFS